MIKPFLDSPTYQDPKIRNLLPWLENIALALLVLFISGKISLIIDIWLVYIMIMGLLYGQAHSLFAAGVSLVAASSGLPVLNQPENQINIAFLEMIISYLFLAIIAGFSKSGSIIELNILRDANDRMDQLYRRASSDLNEARQAAVILGENLKTSDRSYGKLYRIIKSIDGLESSELLDKVPEVIKELTGFETTALYIAKKGATMDLYKGLQEGCYLGETLLLDSETNMEVMEEGKVYINWSMKRDTPDAIIPIENRTLGRIYGVATISNVPFDRMNAYSRQMLSFAGDVLSDYLTKSLSHRPNSQDGAERGTAI